ncbi:sugar transferase (plasmid) [Enterococcus faecium]|uniref:sugar transferase n=1 Tax=Enterococcus faecium TaxID=1352 RepID=UPI0038D45661
MNTSRFYYCYVKRFLDILLSLLIGVLLLTLFLITSLLIKLDSPGPVFFSQIRIGENGIPFRMYKFRTMCQNAKEMKAFLEEANEKKCMFKIKKDPRITTIGKHLRRSSIDELPQLWNVIKGDMSLVGPRPGLPEEVVQYTDEET